MIFLNYIRFKNGKLRRGERCLYKGSSATYMGSYVERGHTVDMFRCYVSYDCRGLLMTEEFIDQCTDRSLITCIAQQEPVIEGQMKLC